MNTVVSKLENFFALSKDNIDNIADQAFTFDRYGAENSVTSVNNYFKSMKEIEAEFVASMNAAKTTLRNMISDIGQFGHNLIYMDGDINFPDPDDIHQGYMEENY
jgi:hypothetical protein